MLRTATLSPDGLYRYTLGRRWATGPTLGVVMLNPSTADGLVDDPTIRRCIGIACMAGYGALTVVNLFAFRAAHPAELWRAAVDRVGPENDAAIRSATACCESLLLAWGAPPPGPRGSIVGDRAAAVERLLDTTGARRLCVGVTMLGHPRHPLYVRSTQTPIAYRRDTRWPAGCAVEHHRRRLVGHRHLG